MKQLFKTFDEKILLYAENNEFDPEFNLFLWCVLTNRFEIAKIFWQLGKVIMSCFLFSSDYHIYYN